MEKPTQQPNSIQSLPNVLLLGNGILRSMAKLNNIEYPNWEDSVLNLSETPNINREELKNIPYSLLATIVANVDDSARHNKYVNVFKTLQCEDQTLLSNLVSLQFNAILTTNYTYEIENCFHSGYSELKDKLPYAKTSCQERSKNGDKKYLLHTYNNFKNKPPIWHIHGECRNKSSMILTHDEYSRLIHKLVEENRLNKNKYANCATKEKYSSWLDYFLISNLYIVGLGMDFSEFDLWWILNRRKREKAATGKIILFTANDIKPEVKKALKELDVNIISIKPNSKEDYTNVYTQATEQIKRSLKQQKGVL